MFMPTTEIFTYNFTDTDGNVFIVDVTATNSIANPDIYIADSASGTINGVVCGLGTLDTPDNAINVSGTDPNYSPTTGLNLEGMSFNTAAGDYHLYYDDSEGNAVNGIVYSNTPFTGYFDSLIPSSFQLSEIACFTSGTLISTPTGSTPVQDLRIGGLILNHLGQAVPVKWIGRQRIHPAFAGDNLPICIRSGALGNGLPLRDLYVSPGHALYVDNCLLIDAKALVNGTTITQVTQWEGDVQYLHIETEHHEIILAEGTAAETFMDNVSRTCFNNYSEYEALYPQALEMIELDIPRVSHKRQLPNAVKAKLEAISEGLRGEEKTVNAA